MQQQDPLELIGQLRAQQQQQQVVPQAPTVAPSGDDPLAWVAARRQQMAAEPVESDAAASTPGMSEPDSKPGAGFLDNLVESGKHFIGGIAHAVGHLDETAMNLAKVGTGTVQLVVPEPMLRGAVNATRHMLPATFLEGARPEDEPLADYTAYPKAVAKMYKDRYGSLEQAGHTLYTDPVGALADVASVAYPAGSALKATGLARAGSTLAKVAEFTDPISVAGKVLGKTVQPVLKNTAEHIVNVNMQIPKAIRRRDKALGVNRASDVLETGRGTNPFTRLSHGGEANAEKMVADQGEKFADLVSGYDTAGGSRLSLQPVEDALNDAIAEAQRQGNAQPRVAQIRQVLENLKNNLLYHTADQHVPTSTRQVPTGATNAQGLPIMQSVPVPGYIIPGQWIDQTAEGLNELKVNTDRNLSKAYGADVEATKGAEKTLARSADTVLDANVPGADAANQIRSRTLRARDALNEAILSKQTKRGMGLAEGLLAGGAALVGTGHPGAAAMTLPWVYNTVVKHPSLSSPVAAGAYAAGTFSMGPKARALEQAGLVGSRVNEAQENAKHPVTRTQVADAMAGFEEFKASGGAPAPAAPAVNPIAPVASEPEPVTPEVKVPASSDPELPTPRITVMPPDVSPARPPKMSAVAPTEAPAAPGLIDRVKAGVSNLIEREKASLARRNKPSTVTFPAPAKPDAKFETGQPPSGFDARIKELQKRMEAAGHPVYVVSKRRSASQQAKLYAQGRSLPGPIITEKSGQPGDESRHQAGLAVDFGFVTRDGHVNQDDKNNWNLLGQTARDLGLTWGGDWTSLNDRVHVEQSHRDTPVPKGSVVNREERDYSALVEAGKPYRFK